MKLVGHHSRKELWITLSIWAVLMVFAVSGIFLLRANALRIIDHIHYVNVSRGAKATVLYAEAEKNAWEVLKKAEKVNRLSAKKYDVPANDKHLQRSIALYNEALETDIREEFDPGRTMHYEILGQVYDAAGNRPQQMLAHTRALIAQRDTEDALKFINLLRDAQPEMSDPLLLQAQLYDLNGETTDALNVLTELESHYDMTPKAHWVKGRILNRLGHRDEALTELEKALAAQPEVLLYRRDLGIVLAEKKQTERAIEVLKPGLDYGAWMDAAYLHVLGNFLTDAGDYKEAIRVLKQADDLAWYSGDIQWSLAKAYHLDDQPRRSAEMLKRAIEIRPELKDLVF